MLNILKILLGVLLLYPTCYLVGLATAIESFSLFFPTGMLIGFMYVLACAGIAAYTPKS